MRAAATATKSSCKALRGSHGENLLCSLKHFRGGAIRPSGFVPSIPQNATWALLRKPELALAARPAAQPYLALLYLLIASSSRCSAAP